MPEAWGSATANKGGGGGSDPNVLKLQESNRIRLLDAEGPRKWRQHGIDGKVLHELFPSVDPAVFRSLTCPRGPDGTGPLPCPLDMKPSYIHEGKAEQLFPVSVRYAANVWDYESGSVKVLVGGKQIFAEFDAVAQAGFDATGADFMIIKMGKDRQTSYKVVRGSSDPLPKDIKPEDLHVLDKYEASATADRIFEILADVGVDYDAIPLPEFTLDAALQFPLPYTKHKNLTMEQLYAADPDFMKWLYGEKRSTGQYGDAVFQAMHTVLLSEGETTPLDDIPKAPPRAAVKLPPQAPPSDRPDVGLAKDAVLLIAPGATEAQGFPQSAEAGLLAAGFTRPEPPAESVSATELRAPDGSTMDITGMPRVVVDAMVAAGYQYVPLTATTPADGDVVVIEIGGTKASMPYGQAKSIIESGAATLVEA